MVRMACNYWSFIQHFGCRRNKESCGKIADEQGNHINYASEIHSRSQPTVFAYKSSS